MTESHDSDGKSGCVLLFSGGRDSTIAALRLNPVYRPLLLLTITSAHLHGIETVKSRLNELRRLLSPGTEWIHAVAKPNGLGMEYSEIKSCLPCHSVYFLIALRIADDRGIAHIAAGYAGYQSSWLEQTPAALDQLTRIMGGMGKTLLVPAQNVLSKDEAKSILRSYELSDRALEQKCTKQQFNTREIQPDRATKEIENWGRNLERVLSLRDAGDFVEIRETMIF